MLKKGKKQIVYKEREWTVGLNFALLAVIVVLIAWGIILVRDKILRNANTMGSFLAQSYANEEENRISVYKMFISLGADYIRENMQGGDSGETIQRWLARYSSHLDNLLGGSIMDPYVIIDGEIIAANPWPGDSSYNYAETDWYQKAVAAEGEIVFTDAYTDAITGKNVITMAVRLDEENNVFAVDILLDDFHTHKNKQSIPDNSAYFLFDNSGNLIYLVGELAIDDPYTIDYAQRLKEGIESGAFFDHNASITDYNGHKLGIYYYYMNNGWLSVITMPFDQILQDDMDSFYLAVALLGFVILITIAVFLFWEYKKEKRMAYITQTLQILGDTYYAIYRIDFKEGTYYFIKSTEEVRERLGLFGNYTEFMNVMQDIMDEKTLKEFEESFSLKNIEQLISRNIYEFGGDYLRKFDDGYKWVNVKIVYREELGLNEVLMCFKEVDKEKKQKLQHNMLLESTLDSMQKMSKQKSIFFSNVSHDMRTPLNAIIGLTELAKRNPGDREKIQEYLNKIQLSGKQLLNLINDILDISKLELGSGIMLDYKPINLSKCIEDSSTMFQEQAKLEHKNLHISVNVKKTMVYADAFRLNQILNNLLSNALKYSEKGADITVELRQLDYEKNHGKYQLKVKDTGIGMSEEFLEKLFEPFTREKTFSEISIQGTGLGMPIVKSLVEQMSGVINVESRLGEGTTFTITLPFQVVEESETAPENSEPDTNIMQGRTVLVAEDNEINMEITTELLTMMGAEVKQAWNGREAVEIFEASPLHSIDFILMDMQMPVMDGCTACKAIRNLTREDARTVAIIAVTANAFVEDVEKTAEAGMNAHISKPINLHLLCEELQRLLPADAGH